MSMTWYRDLLAVAALALVLSACGGGGGSTSPTPDAGAPDAAVTHSICGNSIVEPGEACDDGNNLDEDECLTTCQLSCGDGILQTHEKCDTAIAAGAAGACPLASCSDGDACTTDTASGVGCQLECVHGAITAPVAGDGCCPPGADINSDADCPAGCGNGVVETGETCDTAIAAGQPGACPQCCSDGQACTVDSLEHPASCTAASTHAEITVPAAGDGCCPQGANNATDSDCSVSCGDGLVTAGEACDTGIAAGQPGACPQSCGDADTCTTDTLIGGGTCGAGWTHPPINTPR
jgi:cysteine-rich repeat protein